MAQTVPVAKEMNRAARHHEIMAELENMKTTPKDEKHFAEFKKHSRRNLIILDKVIKLMQPIFEETDKVEIEIKDGHPQMRYTHNKQDK